jgi:predicted outer membrane repeat protein
MLPERELGENITLEKASSNGKGGGAIFCGKVVVSLEYMYQM